MPADEAGALNQEVLWQIRLKLYKHLDLLALNPEGHFDLSFLKYDSGMAEDIEALRRLWEIRDEPKKTKAALSMIFSNPYTLLCETVCAEIFNLIYSAMLWRDRDLVPEIDLEERRKLAPHTLSLPETEEALDQMIKILQSLKKKPSHRAPKRPPDKEVKRRIKELLKQRNETVDDLDSINRAILDVASYLRVDQNTIRKSWYSKKITLNPTS